jgi:hypothetical protein
MQFMDAHSKIITSKPFEIAVEELFVRRANFLVSPENAA